MKKKSALLWSFIAAALIYAATLSPVLAATVRAVPSAQKLTINGTVVDNIPVYTINGLNYFKLRDLAYYLDYEVDYVKAIDAIVIMRGGHGSTAGVSTGKATKATNGTPGSQRIVIDTTDYSGKLHPVNIANHNYFQLRELAQYAGYGVQYDGASNSILVNSDYNYTTNGLVSKKPEGWKQALAATLAADKNAVANNKVNVGNAVNPQQQQVQKPTEVTSISLKDYSVTIEDGKTYQILPTANPAGVSTSYTYSSDKPSVARVSRAGLVTGEAGGVAKITVTSANGKTATMTVNVNGYNYDDAKEVFRLVNEERTKRNLSKLDYFEEMQPVADIRAREIVTVRGHDAKPVQLGRENLGYGYTSAESATYAWVYDDADSNWGHRDNILAKDDSIVVGCYWYKGAGYWSQNFWDGTDYTYGKLPANASPATKKAKEILDELNKDKPTSVNFDSKNVSVVVGEVVQLKANVAPSRADQTLTYAGSNDSVATVDKNGKVTGVKAGGMVVTATTVNGKTATCIVTVKEAAKNQTTVSLSQKSATIEAGGTYQLQPTLSPSGSTDKITYYSYDTKIATVSDSGLITGVGEGSTSVEARLANGNKASCIVTVNPKQPQQTTVTISPKSATINVGETYRLNPTVIPSTSARPAYSSSDSGVATVDADGTVTGVKAGVATIEAAVNGARATFTITVKEPQPQQADISISPNSATIELGETYRLQPTLTPATGETIGYSSSDNGVASVSADGTITGNGAGTATVTASLASGRSVSFVITVKPAEAGDNGDGGNTGDVGDNGDNGNNGDNGDIGNDGGTGDVGNTGDTGETGDNGEGEDQEANA